MWVLIVVLNWSFTSGSGLWHNTHLTVQEFSSYQNCADAANYLKQDHSVINAKCFKK